MRHFKILLLVCLLLVVNGLTVSASAKEILTDQSNVTNVVKWLNQDEFYYVVNQQEDYLFNVKTSNYDSVPVEVVFGLPAGQLTQVRYDYVMNEVRVIDSITGNTRTIQLSNAYVVEELLVSPTGQYAGLWVYGVVDYSYRWVILNTETLELMPINLASDEFSYGSIIWSEDESKLVMDIGQLVEGVMSNAGFLIYNITEQQITHRFLEPSREYTYVWDYKGDTVLYANRDNLVHSYNLTSEKKELVWETPLALGALLGDSRTVYTVIDGQLCKLNIR